jgi:dihydropteroate synthase
MKNASMKDLTPGLQAGGRWVGLETPVCMGVLNVTPDSFSDGASLAQATSADFRLDTDKLLRRAEAMVSAGAVFLDVGGESTRPGAAPVSVDEELRRVVPAIELLRERFDACLSVDTSSAPVMIAAIAAGAELVNDVRALADDAALGVIVETGTAVCLMHMRGQPRFMQSGIQPTDYTDVVTEVADFLSQRRQACLQAGVLAQSLLLDPGFGFGKSQTHNYQLLNGLGRLASLGAPLLIGVSRKSMIGAATGRAVDARLAGSIAAATLALQGGAKIIRAHDVAATVDAIRVHCAFTGNLALD